MPPLIRPFAVDVPQPKLDWIMDRVRAYPWAQMPDAEGWDAGTSVPFMRALTRYWADGYDWRSEERALNRFPQFLATVDGIDLHFYHVRSRETAAPALLLLHGWPGSVVEFLDLIGPLSDPAAHGGKAADAFHVIVPSLPGYGFSGRPPRPIGPDRVAAMMAKLMTEQLGYDRYLVQGGDWGAIIATLMGHRDPAHCAGIHLNMPVPGFGQRPSTEEEAAWKRRRGAAQRIEGGYSRLQMTRPQSLGFAMCESPVGVAAWILEKFGAWSDLPRDGAGEPDPLSCHPRDRLLTNVMLYLVTDAFVTATWLYYGFAQELSGLPIATGERCPVPTGVAAFPDPLAEPPPRAMAERFYDIVRWVDMPRGGHFAALEAPALLIDDVRAFARDLATRHPSIDEKLRAGDAGAGTPAMSSPPSDRPRPAEPR